MPEIGTATAEKPETAPTSRGRTTVAPRVVEKIAARAVDEVGPAGGAARRLLGLPLGSDDRQSRAQVSATLDGDIATVAVHMSITYPAPIGRTADAARDRVIAWVRELTGLHVRQIDIDVVNLTRPTERRRVE